MTGTASNRVAVVDDDGDLRAALCQALSLSGFEPVAFSDGARALAAIDAEFPGVVLTDLRMPGMDGIALFGKIAALDPDLPVVVLTGHGDVPTAVDLLRRGAYDFITKPFATERLLPTVRRALEKRTLVIENRRLRQESGQAGDLGWVGGSTASEWTRAMLRQEASRTAPLLISGESGTGKSHAAAILHRLSGRSGQPLVTVECGSLPADNAASVLFGHVSGAFPGATGPRAGQLRRAQRGTLVLERVELLPAELQIPLARALDIGAVFSVGSDVSVSMECRVVATSEVDLRAAGAHRQFDPALYYRLASRVVELAPLRERRDDVLPLFHCFVQNAAETAHQLVPELGPDVWARLKGHDWPGNAHELRSYAKRIVAGIEDWPAHAAKTDSSVQGLRASLARFEAEQIRLALARAAGDVEAARSLLGLARKTLYDKMARHAIVAATFREN